MNNSKILSALEVSQILHVSKNTVYELIRRGEINHFNVGRKIRFTQEDVNNYITKSHHEGYSIPPRITETHKELPADLPVQDPEFIISGQDVILDILSNYLQQYGVMVSRAFSGSFESLIALYHGKVHAATSHLWDRDTNIYNLPYVRRLMPGTEAVLINLSYRMQGFYVQKGNPKHIYSWEDLARKDVHMLNHRRGSGSRILLDEKLRELNIPHNQIKGYQDETTSHLTLANVIAHGQADVGLGTERITHQKDNLDFIPLQEERHDMVIKKDDLRKPPVQYMLQILNSEEFRKELSGISGNSYRNLGKIVGQV